MESHLGKRVCPWAEIRRNLLSGAAADRGGCGSFLSHAPVQPSGGSGRVIALANPGGLGTDPPSFTLEKVKEMRKRRRGPHRSSAPALPLCSMLSRGRRSGSRVSEPAGARSPAGRLDWTLGRAPVPLRACTSLPFVSACAHTAPPAISPRVRRGRPSERHAPRL